MLRFILRRVLLLVLVLLGVSLVTFVLTNIVPTDPARAALGFDATPEMVQQYRRETGMDQPGPVRYLLYLNHLAHGDLGMSITSHRPVLDELGAALPATVELTIASLVFSVLLGGLLGLVGAVRRGSALDVMATSIPTAQLSIPIFALSLILLLAFYRELGWLPGGGRLDSSTPAPLPITGLYTIDSLLRGQPDAFRQALVHLVLPALALSNLTLAEMTRITRSAFIGVLDQDYVRTANAKGLPRRLVLWRHTARNAAIPILTVMGLRLGFLMNGAVVTETIFSWPGIGRYAWQGAQNFDLNVVMGVALAIAAIYSLINLVVDVISLALDPRLRAA